MRLTDRLYGSTEINDSILIDLIESPSVQRLQGIAQFGVPDEYYHLKNYSRYEHSIGVLLLLRSLGARLDEQIAGLLHDVSHTAFSHVYDWIIKDTGGEEEAQDSHHTWYLQKSEIPSILSRHGFKPEEIFDGHGFSLLELPAPDICADRLDYALREMPSDMAEPCLCGLIKWEEQIIFKDQASALTFAQQYLNLQITHWGGFESTNRYYYFGQAMKRALEIQCLEPNDFWHDDAFVMTKIRTCEDPKIKRILSALKIKDWSLCPQESIRLSKKFRHVDPLCLSHGQTVRLSDISHAYKILLETERQNNAQGLPMAIIP